MKKYISFFLMLSVFFNCNIVFASDNYQSELPFVEVVVKDHETKAMINYDVVDEKMNIVSATKSRTSNEETYVVEYEGILAFELPNNNNQNTNINPLSDITINNDKYYVRANLQITYTVTTDQEYIKLSNVSGSWTGLIDGASMTFSDKVVNIHDGVFGGNTLVRYPTASSFSYNTGWGYVLKYPSSSELFTGARASSYTVASFNSMGGSAEIETILVVP